MHAKKTNKTKLAVILLALALLIGGAVGGTLAWLIDTTDEIVNTFTVGDINITLTETGAENNAKSFKMIPGDDISKDPTVTVVGGSEACWLFVKVEAANGVALAGSSTTADYITYAIDSNWKALDGVTGVYYREVATSTADQPFSVLAGNEVHVLDTVTKAMMEAITDGNANAPTLTFNAYAIQSANIADASAAWTAVNAPST